MTHEHSNPCPGAPESNAGDDFHLVWAARRALSMLQPGAELLAIRLEGPDPSEAQKVDPIGDQLHGIDLTEYYGGKSFPDARLVVHSQLKYSTRRPDALWTATELAKGTRQGTGSAIHRLAQVFGAYTRKFGANTVLAKLRLRLVSNRPVDPNLVLALTDVKHLLSDSDRRTPHRDFRTLVRPSHCKHLQKLQGAAKLQFKQFCQFLLIFDLDGCGEGSRLRQEISLVREIGSLGFFDAFNQYNKLKGLVHRQIMPEGRRIPVITADDLAPCLGIADRSSLFPCPARFEQIERTIDREQIPDIARRVIAASRGPVCLHGSAGMGKTTLVRTLQNALPAGSITILFDCYGGGSYLDPSEARHSHSRALMQIMNELAVSTGTPLLLNREQCPEDLLHSLRRRLQVASEVVRSTAPDALLVLILDACDNSITAAQNRGECSFVPDLVKISLPEGCRLVVTARTHRKNQLGLTATAESVELQPFTLSESRLNLRAGCPRASEQIVEEFHELSGGVPRIQGYAFRAGAGRLEQILGALRPAGMTVETLIDEQLRQAALRCGSEALVEEVCRAVLALPRPIPVAYVARLSGVAPEAVRDLCFDLCQGFRLEEEERISFRDEDFETHLRQRVALNQELYSAIADLLSDRSSTDEYAAEHLAHSLRLAGRRKDLIELIERERQPRTIRDPAVRQDVFTTRARLAIEAALALEDDAALVKLLFIVAEAAKADDAVKALLLNNSDLACRYADPTAVQRLYLSTKERRVHWYGPTHLICAAHYARQPQTISAAGEHLRAAEAWLRHWMSLPDRDRDECPLDHNDLSRGAEAVLRLNGPQAAIAWLSRWRPPDVVFRATETLIRHVIAVDGRKSFDLLGGTGLRTDVLTVFVGSAFEAGLLPPRKMVLEATRAWYRFLRAHKDAHPRVGRHGILLCEVAAVHNIDRNTIAALLRLFTPQAPKRPLSFYSSEELDYYELWLRAVTLDACIHGVELEPDANSLLPLKLRQKPPAGDSEASRRHGEELAREKHRLGLLLPSHMFRAAYLLGIVPPDEVEGKLKKTMMDGSRTRSWKHQYEYDERSIRRISVSAQADVAIRSESHSCFQFLCDSLVSNDNLDLILLVAEKAVHVPKLHDQLLRLVSAVHSKIQADPMPGSEQVSLLIRCCRLAGNVDPEAGRHYFEHALYAASELDEEGFSLLKCVSALATKTELDVESDESRQYAEDLACVVESCHWRFEGWDHFPWRDCIRAIAWTNPAIALAVLGRWDQRGIVNIIDYLNELTHAGLLRETVSPEAAVSFIVLSPLGSDAALATALEALDVVRCRTNTEPEQLEGALRILCNYAIRIAPIENRRCMADAIKNWTEEKAPTHARCLQPLNSLLAFLNGIDSQKKTSDMATKMLSVDKTREKTHRLSEDEWREVICDRGYEKADDFVLALSALKALFPDDMSLFAPPECVEELLIRVAQATHPRVYCQQLTALVKTNSDFLDFHLLLEALNRRLENWRNHPRVQEWEHGLPRMLAEYRWDDFFYGELSSYKLEMTEKELGIAKGAMISALLKHLPTHLKSLDARGIYSITEFSISSFRPDDVVQAFRWILPHLRTRLARQGLTAAGVARANVPMRGRPFESGLLWFLFGHPDRRIRWRGVHAARHLVELAGEEILASFRRELSEAKHTSPYLMEGTTFYRLAARQWFFLLADRLAVEIPHAVAPITDLLVREILAPDTPHALAMHFAKRAVLRLSAAGQAIDRATSRRIQKTLRPRIQKPGKCDRSTYWGRRDYRSAKGKRFHFDATDTLPYWYDPLGRRFGVTGDDFCQLAERWICNKWHFSGSVWTDDPVRKWRLNGQNWQLARNGHGSQPTIETLTTYLELNAMFCVAAELAATRPVLSDAWDEDDPWSDWVERWDVASNESWLSDRRQPTPMEESLWYSDGLHKAGDVGELTDGHFDKTLGLANGTSPEYLVVYSEQNKGEYESSEHISIRSAMASMETAGSLLHALHACPHHVDYRIPEEGDDLEFDARCGDIAFRLKGWLKIAQRDSEGAERDDPLRYGLENVLVRPGTAICSRFKLTHDKTKYYRRGDTDMAVCLVQHWNDCPRVEYETPFGTSGYRLLVRTSELLSFLSCSRASLILECVITRHHGGYRRGEDKYEPKTKLYLLHSDGSIEAVRRDDRVG